MSTYRDDRAALRNRLEEAVSRYESRWAEVQERLDALQALGRQLREKGEIMGPLPVVARRSIPGEGERATLSLSRMVELAAELEADGARLEREADDLAHLVASLNDRTLGKTVSEELAAPPRSVPISYTLGELFVLRAIPFLAAGLVATAYLIGGPMTDADPALQRAAGAAVLAASLALATRRCRRNLRMLREGKVASYSVLQRKPTSVTTSGPLLAHAKGWVVTREGTGGRDNRVLLRIVTHEGDIVERRITETAGIKFAGVILYTRSAKGKVTIARIDDFGSYPRPGLRGAWRGGLPWLSWVRAVVAAAVILPLLGWWILGIVLG